MKFKEYYNGIDFSLTWNKSSYLDKEFILDECKDFEGWEEFSELEKIKLFASLASEYLEESIKDMGGVK